MEKGKVSIILTNWNNTNDNLSVIPEILNQTYKNFDVVLVDNDSPDKGINRLKKEFGDQVIILETGKNLGYSGGNNFGLDYAIKHLNPEYILFLNSDVFLDKEFLFNLVKGIKNKKGIGAVNPKIYYYNDKDKIWFIDGPINWFKGTTHSKNQGILDNGQFKEEHESDRLVGTAMLIKTNILKDIGGFDDKYFLYMEDVDLSIRIKREGYKLMVIPASIIWHNESTASGGSDSPRIIYYFTRNTLIFMKKYGSRMQFITSTMYGIYFCLRRFVSHVIKGKLKISTIKATYYAYHDFLEGLDGKLTHTIK